MSLLSSWAERSQRTARRNAMVAATALAERRRQHDEVAAYLLTAVAHRREATAPPARERALG